MTQDAVGEVVLELEPGPILVVTVAGYLDRAQVDRYLHALEEPAGTGEPFAMLTVYSGARPRKDAAAHQAEKQWLAAHRLRLRGVLVAVGLVHRAGPVRRVIERVAPTGAGSRLFGCPCRPFAALDEATAWAADRVRAARP